MAGSRIKGITAETSPPTVPMAAPIVFSLVEATLAKLNGKGEVIALYPLMANRMSVDRDDKGHLYYQYQMQDSDAPTMKNGTVILRQLLKPISSPRFTFILMPSFTFFDVDSTSF